MNRIFKVLINVFTKPFEVKQKLSEFRYFKKIGLSPILLSFYLIEILRDNKFWKHIDNEIKKAYQVFTDPRLGGWILDSPSMIIYSIVRIVKPDIVIETGVGPGGSSALILNALQRNNKGHLYSIDLPGYDSVIYPEIGRFYNIHVPPGYETGWLVPQELRSRWSLIIGDSKQKLPELLERLSHVDIFFHDSLHTDEHIFFELNCVFPKLRNGGLLLADDVNEYWSYAFVNFCQKKSLPYFIQQKRLGVAVKY